MLAGLPEDMTDGGLAPSNQFLYSAGCGYREGCFKLVVELFPLVCE